MREAFPFKSQYKRMNSKTKIKNERMRQSFPERAETEAAGEDKKQGRSLRGRSVLYPVETGVQRVFTGYNSCGGGHFPRPKSNPQLQNVKCEKRGLKRFHSGIKMFISGRLTYAPMVAHFF